MDATPFLFERDFDLDPLQVQDPDQIDEMPAEPDPLELAVTQALAAARAEQNAAIETIRAAALADGLARGREEGRAAARRDLEGDTRELASALVAALPTLQHELAARADAIAAEAGQFVAEVAERLVPGLGELLGDQVASRFVEDALSSLRTAARVTIRVDPARLPIAEAAVAQLLTSEAPLTDLVVRGDPALPAGEIRILWAHGGTALQPARVSKAILDACRGLRLAGAGGAGCATSGAGEARPKRSTNRKPRTPTPSVELTP